MAHQAGFRSKKWLGGFLLPMDGMLILRSVTYSIKFASTHFYLKERHQLQEFTQ